MEEAFIAVCENGISPYSQDALSMRAMIHLRKGAYAEADKVLRECMQLGQTPLAFKMMGDASYLQNRFDEAVFWYQKALKAKPDSADIIHDLAVSHASLGQLDIALPLFRKTIELQPDRADFHHHLAIMLVLNGEQKEGWREMEWRTRVPGVCGTFPSPERYWTGEDLTGKTIVVRAEQGFGDTIQYARYIPALAAKAKKVYFYCQPAMFEFLKAKYPQCHPWPNIVPPPLDFDYHVNVMSFPHLMPGEGAIPPARGTKGEGIGICWYGSPTHKADSLRTVPVKRFEPLAAAVGEQLYCLGYGRFDSEKVGWLKYFIDDSFDWQETAERIKKLDLVITVDTAIGHLSASLGIETWMLLPYGPDFRWGLKKTDGTPLYPAMKFYRQPKLFDWDSVFSRVEADLKVRYAK